jgi:hypothetical protein
MSVRREIDIGRLSKAVERPGIDPRVWLEQAEVVEVGVDLQQGVFVDCKRLLDKTVYTARLGADYAGDGFGTLRAPKKGDVVLVAVPRGDRGACPVVIARLFCGSIKPPPEFGDGDPSADPVTVVEPGRTLKVVAKQGASVSLTVMGGAEVKVSSDGPVTVKAPMINLGSAAGVVARYNDTVKIEPGNPAGPVQGVMTLVTGTAEVPPQPSKVKA